MSKDVPADIGFTFEAVLEAVQESGRGRWFLDEYRKRMGHEDVARMMDAITRIESRMEGMAGHLSAADDLARVRQAISATRNEIERLGPPKDGLSAEGRLFAHLAELARKAMPQEGAGNAALPAGIEKTLRLVDSLDATLNSNVTAFPAPAAKAGDRYFQQDAQLFEKPAATPMAALPLAAAPVAPPKPVAEKTPMGAKLTITRAAAVPPAQVLPDKPVEVEVAPAVAEHAAPTPAEAAPPVESPAPVEVQGGAPAAPPVAAKPRIVIIRRKPEDLPEMPLPPDAEKPPTEQSAA